MKSFDKPVKAHLFVCCRNRQNEPCCQQKGAETLVNNLRKWAKHQGLKESIKISRSSCLGHCEEGITACLYPQNKWLTHLSLEHEEELKKLLSSSCES